MSDLARLDKNRPKRSTSSGAPMVQGGWGLTNTHTYTLGNVGERWGRIFPLAISMSSIEFLDECWVWTMASNTRRGWVRGQNFPIEYANHYTINGYGKVSWILNQFMLLFHFPLFFYLYSFSHLDYFFFTDATIILNLWKITGMGITFKKGF
jgi:hypothetical protein